jgi:hypothetical protein
MFRPSYPNTFEPINLIMENSDLKFQKPAPETKKCPRDKKPPPSLKKDQRRL